MKDSLLSDLWDSLARLAPVVLGMGLFGYSKASAFSHPFPFSSSSTFRSSGSRREKNLPILIYVFILFLLVGSELALV